MQVIRELRQRFWLQIALHGIIQSAMVLAILGAVSFLTSDELRSLRRGIPFAEPAGTWLSQANSWDLFVYIFVFTTVLQYIGQLGGVVIDRVNVSRIADWSRSELQSETALNQRPGGVAATMNLRRRTLEGLLRSDPYFIATLTLVACLIVMNNYWGAATLGIFAIFALAYTPIMIQRFQRIAARHADQEQAGNDQGLRGNGNKTETAIRRAQRRLNIVANRPLIRLQAGWPLLLGATGIVAFVAFTEINLMVRHNLLPGSAALLIATLGLVGRYTLALARDCEDTAFFASNTMSLEMGDHNQEIL
jgi:hypothetical protein